MPPEWTLSGSVVAAEARDRLEPDWARLRLSAARDKNRETWLVRLVPQQGTRDQQPAPSRALQHPQGRCPQPIMAPPGQGHRPHRRACLRAGHWAPESLRGSSRWTDFGRGFLGFALEVPSPCSSRTCCCFLRRYSCLMSSRRAFSSSFRTRSSSALRLRESVESWSEGRAQRWLGTASCSSAGNGGPCTPAAVQPPCPAAHALGHLMTG